MKTLSPEDFKDTVDSMYRLVLVGARRAAQLSKPDARPLVHTDSKKPTVIALEEILQAKVTYRTTADDEEEYVE